MLDPFAFAVAGSDVEGRKMEGRIGGTVVRTGDPSRRGVGAKEKGVPSSKSSSFGTGKFARSEPKLGTLLWGDQFVSPPRLASSGAGSLDISNVSFEADEKLVGGAIESMFLLCFSVLRHSVTDKEVLFCPSLCSRMKTNATTETPTAIKIPTKMTRT